MKKILFSFLLFCFCAVSFGQTGRNLRINEVMSYNTQSITDQYGQKSGWIEFFNTAFAYADIRGCFITNNRDVLKDMSAPERMKLMYQIPKEDLKTKILPRQYIIFFTDGLPNRGTFHTNFQLSDSTSNWIALFDADGISIIDSITVPPLAANSSYAKFYSNKEEPVWRIVRAENVTAGVTNTIDLGESKVSKFKRMDRFGFAITIIAMLIVITTLAILYIGFKYISKGIGLFDKTKQIKATKAINQPFKKSQCDDEDDIAALTMALHQHFSIVHDEESDVLTIKREESIWRLSELRRFKR